MAMHFIKELLKRKEPLGVNMEKQQPIVALMYDFDKTLCAKDMQEYSFIPSVGMNAEAFWKESNEISEKNNMDRILSYMFLMIKMAKNKMLV